MPDRITLSNAKYWRMPPNTVCVTRGPGRKFGNPWSVKRLRSWGMKGSDEDLSRIAVNYFRGAIVNRLLEVSPHLQNLHTLRGKNLACWCKPGQPCHADVLLEIANE